MNSPQRIAAFTVALVLLIASCLPAQTIRGKIVDSLTGVPIGGALVELRDLQGQSSSQALTSSAGTFTFLLSTDHKYQLRIAAIGYTRHEPLTIASAAVAVAPIEIRLHQIAIPLPVLHALAGKVCRSSEVDANTFGGLLDAARTSLEVLEATIQSHAIDFEVQQIRSLTRGDGASIVGRAFADTTLIPLLAWPVFSQSPEHLRDAGFAEQIGSGADGFLFSGIDAHALFSVWFLDTHCFFMGQVAGDSIVIRFAPAAKPKHVDLNGELVLDAHTLALRRLAFTHINLPVELPEHSAGGEITFAQVAGASWVPMSWSMWAPLTRTQRFITRPVIGVRSQATVVQPSGAAASTTVIIGRTEKRGLVTRAVRVSGGDEEAALLGLRRDE